MSENVLINADAYKLSHKGFMPEGVEVIYSNFTARSDKHSPIKIDGGVTFFGLQGFIREYLIDAWNEGFFHRPKEEVIVEFKRLTDNYLGKDSVSMKHFEQLHDLGYLPICIRALPEGFTVPIKVPMFVIYNTHPDFAWLTNYLETVISAELWKPITVATIIKNYRKMVNEYAEKTTGMKNHPATNFQVHGFEFRGMSGREDAAKCGAAFLLSSYGTDTFPAINYLEKYYNADGDNELIAASVPATEHSLASLGISLDGELETLRRWITKDYPKGVVSVISDTLDFFKVVTEYATELKEDILNRQEDENGMCKTVFRPDSGYPPEIIAGRGIMTFESLGDFEEYMDFNTHVDGMSVLKEKWYAAYCKQEDKYYQVVDDKSGHYNYDIVEFNPTPEDKGAIECLWEIFGGVINAAGYKELNPKVGLIYGDSMTPEIAKETLKRLEEKGFASTNLVFGVGSYTSQYVTRDTFGMAIKATAAKVNGEWKELYKDPKTDSGVKKSAKGLLGVYYDTEGELYMLDGLSEREAIGGALEKIFEDGKLLKMTSLTEIRNRVGVNV